MIKKVLLLSTLMMNNIALAYEISITAQPPNNAQLVSGVTTILGAAQWIGFIVGVAMIIYVGVKYLTAGAGKKAEVKSTMIPILVGAALVALAPTIANWVFGMFSNGGGGAGAGASTSSVQPVKPAGANPIALPQ